MIEYVDVVCWIGQLGRTLVYIHIALVPQHLYLCFSLHHSIACFHVASRILSHDFRDIGQLYLHVPESLPGMVLVP